MDEQLKYEKLKRKLIIIRSDLKDLNDKLSDIREYIGDSIRLDKKNPSAKSINEVKSNISDIRTYIKESIYPRIDQKM